MSDYAMRLPNDEIVNLISQYSIPKWMTEYFDGECALYLKRTGETIFIPDVNQCQLCDRLFEEATKPNPVLCQHNAINHEFGYVAKVCIDCYYWIEDQHRNDNIPKSVKKRLDAGHRPQRFDYLVN